jgi:tetratricopeptide (TPR) repeat protein
VVEPSPGTADFMPRPWYARPVVWIAVVVLFVGWVLADWLGQRLAPPRPTNKNILTSSSGEDLFASAIHQLHHLESFKASDPTVRIVEHLNQWLATQTPAADWRPDPLLETVPADLRAVTGAENLRTMTMPPTDRIYLQESVWLHYLAKTAAGDDIAPLARAQRLFDWTVRNIQLAPPGSPEATYSNVPGTLLLIGQGNAYERAWIFLLLARQIGLDGAMLAFDGPDPSLPPQPWVPAILIDGQLYLFEPMLGLPIPGPGGVGVATLEQAADDPAILGALDTPESKYPVTWSQAHRITALVEAAPPALSQRMQLIESRLAGEDRLALTIDASALAARLKACRFVTGARIWTLRYEASAFVARMQRQPDPTYTGYIQARFLPFKSRQYLNAARVYHMKGMYVADDSDPGQYSAVRFYQLSRLPEFEVHNEALRLADTELTDARLNERQMAQLREQAYNVHQVGLRRAREYATYWLGLVAYERGDYSTAVDYFERRLLVDYPESIWRAGAIYNLARCHEALGEYGKAIALYETDDSAQRQGNLLRARLLRQQHPDVVVAPPPDPRPTAEPGVEDTPVEDAPAEDAPAEDEAPHEPAPVEGSPASDPAAEPDAPVP